MAAGSPTNQEESYQRQDDHGGVGSVSGSAQSYALHQGETRASLHSQTAYTSQGSTAQQTDGRTRLSSSARWLESSQEYGRQPGVSPSNYDPVMSFLASPTVGRDSGHEFESSQQHAAVHSESGDPDAQYSWSAQSQSYAGSPGRESLQSWTGSTPARPVPQQDPDSPDARTILKSIARECQSAVAGRSPAVGVDASTVSPQGSARPDLCRTPNTFFNPSFDANEDIAKL